MTATLVTKEWMLANVSPEDLATIPDNDPIYQSYIVVLEDEEWTIAPASEIFDYFRFTETEVPGTFVPIERVN